MQRGNDIRTSFATKAYRCDIYNCQYSQAIHSGLMVNIGIFCDKLWDCGDIKHSVVPEHRSLWFETMCIHNQHVHEVKGHTGIGLSSKMDLIQLAQYCGLSRKRSISFSLGFISLVYAPPVCLNGCQGFLFPIRFARPTKAPVYHSILLRRVFLLQ